jgi:hypothetical protein
MAVGKEGLPTDFKERDGVVTVLKREGAAREKP